MLAERLKLTRQARGLSLDELSEAMDRLVSKQAISKYEGGHDFPSPPVIVALSKALGVDADDLISEPHVKVEPLFFRKSSRLGAKERQRLTAKLSCHLETAVEVRQLVSPADGTDLPVRCLPAANAEEAEAQANRMREEWSLGSDPIGSMVDVLEGHGVSVCLCNADKDFDGLSAIARSREGTACGAAVMCRTGLTRERQRLNLAHELGHIVLKPGEGMDEESTAWRFAGAFVAPRVQLLADVGQRRRSISIEELQLLKARLGMSMQALLMRLNDVGVISDEAKKQAFIQMSRLRIRHHEPGDTLEMETPQWLRSNVLRAVSEGLLDTRRASELLGEEVRPMESKRNQFIHMLASMTVDERQNCLESIPGDEGIDQDWLEADIGGDIE